MDIFQPEKEAADSVRANGFYAPILPYLVSGMLAFGAAGSFGGLRNFAAEMFLGSLSLFFLWASLRTFGLCGGARGAALFFVLKIAGTFLLCAAYFYLRVPSNPYPDFAPRSAVVAARVAEVSTGANGSRYGIAVMEKVPSFLAGAEGRKIWFTVSDGSKKTPFAPPDIRVSQLAEFDGVVRGVYPEQTRSRGHYSGDEKTRAFERYLLSRAIYFKISAPRAGAKILSPAREPFVFFDSVRAYMEKSLSEFFFKSQEGSEAADTYAAMILGDKSRLTERQKESFKDTGTMHVFAISGLHVGFAAAALYGLMSLFGLNWRIQPFAALPALLLYVCACGARPSAMRAFGMVAVVWLALSLGRGLKPFGALMLAAAAALAVSPENIFDAGFALSYGVVASLFVYGIPLFEFLRRKFSPAPTGGLSLSASAGRWFFNFAVGGFCISFGAAVAGAPLSAHFFSYVSPTAVFYSPIFVLGAGIAVSLGFIGFALPAFAAQFLNSAAAFVVGLLSDFAQWGDSHAFSAVDFSMPDGFWAAAALAAFLGLPAGLEGRGALLRFALAPAAAVCIMLLSQFL